MIEITFDNSVKETSAFGLTQWDKGQKLKIIWEDMPEEFQVHFSSRGTNQAIVVSVQGVSGEAVVDIPDILLKNSSDILLWIYLIGSGDVGESTKQAVLYVRPRAKPQTSIDNLEPTQQEILEDILDDINENIRYIKENGTDSEYVPDYVKQQAEAVVKKVVDCRNENSVVFIAASDAHLKNGDYNSENAVKHMSQAMKIIAERCPVDFVAYLGDMTSGGSDKAITDAQSEIMGVNAALYPAVSGTDSFRCLGSEDSLSKAYYRNGGYLDSVMLYNLIGKWNKDMITDEKIRGYGYKDLESEKLRVICLNTSDTHGETLYPYSETATMSIKQLQWLCGALDLSAKTDYRNWRIILLGHHPLNMTGKFNIALQVLEAYVKGSSLDLMTSSGESLICNFAGKNSARILGQFHGHLHNYKVSFITSEKIPLVTIPNAGYYDNNFYASAEYTNAENTAYGETQTYDKTVNSAEDTAFCVVVLDKSTGEIDAIHYGAGIDRNIVGSIVSDGSGDSGDSGSGDGDDDNNENQGGSSGGGSTTYTNYVPLSVNAQGNIYNGIGYMGDNKLTSTGDVFYADGYVHTGFIPAVIADDIRVSGGKFDGTAGNYILVYNSNFELIWVTTLTGSKDAGSAVAYTETDVLFFKPYQVQNGNLANMAYFRVSTVGQGSSLIVTVNEDIDGSEILEDIAPPIATYTNIVQYATDMYGNGYGAAGFRNNYSLSLQGGGQQRSGYVSTGYLDADKFAVIRIKGIDFDGTDGCYLCLYDENFNLISTVTLTGSADSANGITVSKSILTFTPADAGTKYERLAKFRVSGIGVGADLIITYCEEIN